MDITKKMYDLAKQLVATYEEENKTPAVSRIEPYRQIDAELSKKIQAKFDADNYNNPFEVGEIMPCCGQRYCFSYARMKYMPRNRKLTYREKDAKGDIDRDDKSREPYHVEYNNCREAIRQAKEKGLNHVHWKTSVAVSEQIRKDGYRDHNDGLDTISW